MKYLKLVIKLGNMIRRDDTPSKGCKQEDGLRKAQSLGNTDTPKRNI